MKPTRFRLPVTMIGGHGTAEDGGRRPPDDQIGRLVDHFAANAEAQLDLCEACRWKHQRRGGCRAHLLVRPERCPLRFESVFDGREAVAATLPMDAYRDPYCAVPGCENLAAPDRKSRWPLCRTHYRNAALRRRYPPRGSRRRQCALRPGKAPEREVINDQ